MQKTTIFNDVAIVFVKWSDFRIHFWYVSKNDEISIMKNSNLNEKKWIIIIFLLYIKMTEQTYYQRNRDVTLNREKGYNNTYKDRLRDNARDKY